MHTAESTRVPDAPDPDPAPQPARGTGGATRRWLGRALVALVAVLMLVALLMLPWREVRDALVSADLWWLAGALGASLLVYPLWVRQWQGIARPLRAVPAPVMAQVVAVSIGARYAVSGLGGVASGGAALHVQAGLTPTEAAGVMAVDQIAAGVAKLAVLGLALALAPLPAAVHQAAAVLAAACAGLAVVVVLAGRGGGWQRHRIARHPVIARVIAAIARLARDLSSLNRLSVWLPVLALALAKKSLEVASVWAIQRSLGVDGSILPALLAVASVSLVTLLPLAPAHLGPQAVALVSTYAGLGVPVAQAVPVGILHYALALVATLLIGGLALVWGIGAARSQPTPRPAR